ncbi:GTP pyrophosphokinase (ATP:GTP 3'-pyrophosphotransferase) [Aromatoleum aromaticum EbN1]|uniref:GTP pyrophosphokinase n=1 Tax=Aromatoleum aromaticum (strain DSM 19018 / LMG 30748 / EbN1) TaxID=76114 RepID=Q5NYK8_AROAE|nr:bifunctional (p)ppGpp synthetase/guanosine-3',5'-bis(diphosphate) 3'-pyrophosphohydrolase [Aromatoleum aromaticum]CAI09856.1 GTP pyrophosphokinase (ATP:GTP 3'-pyrophosphotransferase) [Aromatoleum aromaticum EbN1]
MVSVTHAISQNDAVPPVELLADGLGADDRALIEKALELARGAYENHVLGTGESVWTHAMGMALIAASLRLDVETRVAALLFAVGDYGEDPIETVTARFGDGVARLVEGLRKLNGLRLLTRMTATATAPEIRAQTEVLRKMLLAMVEDIRVVLLRLASRTQTLRYFTEQKGEIRTDVARESLDIYAPLANRLGVWQLKWELEDLSFRFLEPETYKRIAKMLDERRVERESFIQEAIERLKREIAAVGIKAEVYGRPKHIYSIYNKMRAKRLDFSQVYDIRALRVLVGNVRDCYTVLGIVNQIWQPIGQEFDDYITKPKGNNYQSLHTAVLAGDGRAVEVQIRTHDMHKHAELGVAAHWRYKEGQGHGGDYDEKIALLRSLLSWRDEIADSADWVEKFKRASLDDAIYVLTPQGKVVDLPRGATPIDFAYRLHTDLGHRCRGAKVDGHLVPLNTHLENGQTVEITAAKEGGPSRDWLNPVQGYVATGRARTKIKQYFNQLEENELLARGRAVVTKEMQREGQSQANIDEIAGKLGFKNAESMFVAAGRGEVGPRAVHLALRDTGEPAPEAADSGMVIGQSRAGDSSDKILIVGVGKLLTSLGRCCKPAPPDAIEGFVTRGRGISIHRVDCRDFQRLAGSHPERVIKADWGEQAYNNRQSVFPVDIAVQAADRQGLLRDISEVLSREKLNVIAVNTLTKKGTAYMRFTMEVGGVAQVQRAITLIREVPDVIDAQRK